MKEVFDIKPKPDWAGAWESGILNAWSQHWIAKYGSISEAWNRMAAEYDRDLEHSNRVRLKRCGDLLESEVLEAGSSNLKMRQIAF